MKYILCLFLSATLLIEAVSATESGLFMRAVVDESSEGARELPDKDGNSLFVSPEAIITPDDVETAEVNVSEGVSIRFVFKASAQIRLGEATKTMIGDKLAVIIDGELISAPVVRDPFSESVIITGNFTREWADAVVVRVAARSKG